MLQVQVAVFKEQFLQKIQMEVVEQYTREKNNIHSTQQSCLIQTLIVIHNVFTGSGICI